MVAVPPMSEILALVQWTIDRHPTLAVCDSIFAAVLVGRRWRLLIALRLDTTSRPK
jgi:hypothetical protein